MKLQTVLMEVGYLEVIDTQDACGIVLKRQDGSGYVTVIGLTKDECREIAHRLYRSLPISISELGIA